MQPLSCGVDGTNWGFGNPLIPDTWMAGPPAHSPSPSPQESPGSSFAQLAALPPSVLSMEPHAFNSVLPPTELSSSSASNVQKHAFPGVALPDHLNPALFLLPPFQRQQHHFPPDPVVWHSPPSRHSNRQQQQYVQHLQHLQQEHLRQQRMFLYQLQQQHEQLAFEQLQRQLQSHLQQQLLQEQQLIQEREQQEQERVQAQQQEEQEQQRILQEQQQLQQQQQQQQQQELIQQQQKQQQQSSPQKPPQEQPNQENKFGTEFSVADMQKVIRQAHSEEPSDVPEDFQLHAEGVSDEVWRELVGYQPRVDDESSGESSVEEYSCNAATRLERELSHGLRDEHDYNSIAHNFVSIDGLSAADCMITSHPLERHHEPMADRHVPPSLRSLPMDPFQPSTCGWGGGYSEDSVWDMVQLHLEHPS